GRREIRPQSNRCRHGANPPAPSESQLASLRNPQRVSHRGFWYKIMAGKRTSCSSTRVKRHPECCSSGNINDIAFAPTLIARVAPITGLIADKAYDANSLRRLLAEGGAKAVIPLTASRKQPIPYDRFAYRRRNRIERMFSRLKDFRRVGTRYDKLARNFLAGAILAATVAWWLN
ncbi:transposase, partial [Rhodoplanes elegans]